MQTYEFIKLAYFIIKKLIWDRPVSNKFQILKLKKKDFKFIEVPTNISVEMMNGTIKYETKVIS